MINDDDTKKAPGLTVGQLRKALDGVPDDMEVTIRTDAFCGGITSASPEIGCDDIEHFAIDCSDDENDFDVDE
ncbi:MAG TPA: hypothetical protein VK571_03345 [Gemmatimonadaceae bacterium]|nr:hypothetical protein [Gemmatimonadaceae bacterium]